MQRLINAKSLVIERLLKYQRRGRDSKRTPYFVFVIILFAISLTASLLIFTKDTNQAQAADETCYWVGDTNPAVWNDATHWSSSSGGAGSTCAAGGGVPDSGTAVIFNGGSTNSVTINAAVNIDSLDLQSAYTGTFDNATNDQAITVANNVTMDSTRTDMGDATWTVGGNFDNYHVTTFNRNNSTLVFAKSGTQTVTSSSTKILNTVIINSTSTVTIDTASDSPSNVAGLTVNGTLSIPSGETWQSGYGAVAINTNGSITGSGSFNVYGVDAAGRGITTLDGTISVGILNIFTTSANGTIATGKYDVGVFKVKTSDSNTIWKPQSGTYDINGNFELETSSGAYTTTLDNTNNPSFEISGNVILDQLGGAITWTKGTGTITVNGTVDQNLNFLGKTIEDLNITNTSGRVTLSDGFTSDSLTASPHSYILFNAGDTFSFNTIDINGSSGNPIRLTSTTAGSEWFFNVTAASTATYVYVSDSDASGGSEIDANDGTSVNWGNNTNWLLPSNRQKRGGFLAVLNLLLALS